MSSANLTVRLLPVNGRKVWHYFAPHHYLTHTYTGHRAWIAVLADGTPVGFTSIISFPNGYLKNAWREHRTVVLPDFQGLGIGPRLSEWAGEYVRSEMEGRFFSRTSHPRMGAYRENSPLWRPTTKNKKRRTDAEIRSERADAVKWLSDSRQTFAHEYIGRQPLDAV